GVCTVDLDQTISETYGESIDHLIKNHGLEWFRSVERTVLEELITDGNAEVISVGGGSLLDDTFRRWVRARVYLCTLTATPDVLLKRVALSSTVRPLLMTDDSSNICTSTFHRLLEERQVAYLDSDCVIDTTHLSTDAVVEHIAPLFLCLEAA
ncbi:MAG: shikimate kinase, partial [Bradymonadia bacterium]